MEMRRPGTRSHWRAERVAPGNPGSLRNDRNGCLNGCWCTAHVAVGMTTRPSPMVSECRPGSTMKIRRTRRRWTPFLVIRRPLTGSGGSQKCRELAPGREAAHPGLGPGDFPRPLAGRSQRADDTSRTVPGIFPTGSICVAAASRNLSVCSGGYRIIVGAR
jgi:hypothetical protein